MPTATQIVTGLAEIANAWRGLAVLWHVYFGLLAVWLVSRRRPSRRIAAVLLVPPLASVGILAWVHGNPFNGTVFAVAAAVLLGIGARLEPGPGATRHGASLVAGVPLFLFGWLYPHFLTVDTWWPYLYAAPAGLIPCPTLSMIIGASLVLGGLGSAAWSGVLVALGVFYSLFGAVHLGVTLDWILLVGAVALLFELARGARDRRAIGP